MNRQDFDEEETWEWRPRSDRLWREAGRRNRQEDLGFGFIIGLCIGLVLLLVAILIGNLT